MADVPRLILLKTSDATAEIPSDFERIDIVDDGTGSPQTQYELSHEYNNPVVYLVRNGYVSLMPSSQYTYFVNTGTTTFTFSGVQIGDAVLVHSSGDVIQPSMFVTGDPNETYTRTESFYIKAYLADFVNVTVTVEDMVTGALADSSWVQLSLDQQNWSNSLTISRIVEGNAVKVYVRITVPPSARSSLPAGVMPDLALNISGVAEV